jgi:DNA mismatch repair protein MutL
VLEKARWLRHRFWLRPRNFDELKRVHSDASNTLASNRHHIASHHEHVITRFLQLQALSSHQASACSDASFAGNMSIKALPQTAVRAIGAAQVLTDSSAVVKELIDNALDARATSVAVEIHANTIDSIQVRDNGHGIPPQDRPLVARRYCTSKLTDADDLATIGGSSLGFRGEALASAAEMSGGLTITTRVEGEQVATALKIDQQGEVIAQERASTAVGTTVKITDFIKSNPVRRQVALKHTDQTLKRIKHILQSFAFARPHVRFSLKVLKAKNDKCNWMYASKAGGNAEDAAFKIVGAACASQCTWSVIEEDGFTLQAFLPKSDAAADKISNVGAFMSIDRRPMAANRGLSKQVVKVFREALKRSDTRFGGIKEPFLFLEISCPEQSYDPNIEPAKDDVLFEEPDKVVAAARKLFAAIYSSPEGTQAMNAESHDECVAPPELESVFDDVEDDFVTSLEQAQAIESSRSVSGRTTIPELSSTQSARNDPVADGSPVAMKARAFRTNMYGCDEEDLVTMDARPSTGRTEADFEELRHAQKDVNVSNPWVMAKLNASNRQNDNPRSGQATSVSQEAVSLHSSKDATALRLNSLGPPTPHASSPTSPAMPFHPSDHVPNLRLAHDGRVIESSSPSRDRSNFTPIQANTAAGTLVTPSPSQQRPVPAYNYGVTPQIEGLQGTPLSAIPQVKPRGRAMAQNKTQVNKPFVSPLPDGVPAREKVWFDHLEGIEERGRQRPRRMAKETSSAGLVQQGEMDDSSRLLTPPRRNRDIREFVASVDLTGDQISPALPDMSTRNRPSSRRSVQTGESPIDQDENIPNNYGALSGRGFVPASELAALEAHIGSAAKPMAPPPKRRKTGQGVLRQISGNAPPAIEESEAEQEYRPETASRRRSSAKLQRTKSSQLPLERIPAGKGTQNLVMRLDITPEHMALKGQDLDPSYSLLGWNEPAIDAYDVFAEERNQDEVRAMGDKLHELLINRVSDGEMVQDLGKLVDAALSAHAESFTAEDGEDLTPSQEMLDVTQ